MTEAMRLAEFVCAARYEDIGALAREQIKIRLLDTLGVWIAALDAGPEATGQLGSDTLTPWMDGGGTPGQAMARGIQLARRIDCEDVYLSAGGVCHPSDSIGAVLAAAGRSGARGAELLTALAVAYQVGTRLADALPTSETAADAAPFPGWAARAGVGKVMRQDLDSLAQSFGQPLAANAGAAAAASAGHAAGATAVEAATQSGAAGTVPPQSNAARAKPGGPTGQGVTLPEAVDWSGEGIEGVLGTIVRPYATAVYFQSAVDVALGVSTPPLFRRDAVHTVRVKTFQAACAAGGRDATEGVRNIETPRQARGSLPYVIAVALLDRRVGPAQFAPERIRRDDVQTLLRKVEVIPLPAFTASFPAEMRAQIEVGFDDATWYCTSASSFAGFTLQPMGWNGAADKFLLLAAPVAGEFRARRILRCIRELEVRPARELLALLARVRGPAGAVDQQTGR